MSKIHFNKKIDNLYYNFICNEILKENKIKRLISKPDFKRYN